MPALQLSSSCCQVARSNATPQQPQGALTYSDVLHAAWVYRVVVHGQAALVAVHMPAQHLHSPRAASDRLVHVSMQCALAVQHSAQQQRGCEPTGFALQKSTA